MGARNGPKKNDPTIVSLTNVSAGGLGQSFNMETNLEEGRICVALVRDEALGGGAGTLFYLDCWLNPGTVPGMSSLFAIADRSLSGLHAVNFSWGGATVGQSNGVLRVVTASQDTDANGLPDWWEEAYFDRATGTNPQGDDDGDGQSNYAEFRAGTDPRNASDYLRISGVSVGPPFRIEFPTVIGKTYRIEYSGDLTQWLTLASGISGTGATEQVSDSASGNTPRRFYRIVVE